MSLRVVVALLHCVALVRCAYLAPSSAVHRRTAGISAAELASADLPTSPKATAESLSLAVQAALADGARRLEIALPAGVRFSEGSKQTLGTQSTTASERAMGDLELACLLVEVFQNERDACCVVLPDAKAVTAANRAWKSTGYTPRIETRSALGKGLKGGGGFGAKGGGAEPRVLVLVRPTTRDVRAAEKVLGDLEGERLCIALNAKAGVAAGYTPTFVLESSPHPDWLGGLLFRAYPSAWALAVAGKVGAPRVHGRSAQRPELDAIDAGFWKVKLEKNPMSVAAGTAAALEPTSKEGVEKLARIREEEEANKDDNFIPGLEGVKLPEVKLPEFPNPFGGGGG